MTRQLVNIILMFLPVWRPILTCYDELTASRSKMAQPDMPELVVGSQLTGGSGYRIDYALVGYLTQALIRLSK